MAGRTLITALFVAISAFSAPAPAQLAYRCGNSYSQTPCPDGVAVDASDKRTAAQKQEADLATRRDAKTASSMEKARLAQEARDLAANTPAVKASRPASAGKSSTSKSKKVRVKKVATKTSGKKKDSKD
jgi:hypothetical protein